MLCFIFGTTKVLKHRWFARHAGGACDAINPNCIEGFFGEKPTEKVRWDSIGGAMFSIQQASTTNWQPEVPIPENHDWYALQTRVRFEFGSMLGRIAGLSLPAG
jgi:hypothetical protein